MFDYITKEQGKDVGDKIVFHAGAPGIGKAIYQITRIDDRGIWAKKLSSDIRVPGEDPYESKVTEEKWGVWARSTGGITGTREAWTKVEGEVEVFDTREEASERAAYYRSKLSGMGPAVISYFPEQMIESKITEGRNYFIPSSHEGPRGEDAEITKGIQQAVNRRLVKKAFKDGAGYHLKGVKDPSAINALLPAGVTIMRESKVDENYFKYSSQDIADHIEGALKPLGYWFTERATSETAELFEFISTDGPKVKVSLEYDFGGGEAEAPEESVKEDSEEMDRYASGLVRHGSLTVHIVGMMASGFSLQEILNWAEENRHSREDTQREIDQILQAGRWRDKGQSTEAPEPN
jgi:hypothetical protein